MPRPVQPVLDVFAGVIWAGCQDRVSAVDALAAADSVGALQHGRQELVGERAAPGAVACIDPRPAGLTYVVLDRRHRVRQPLPATAGGYLVPVDAFPVPALLSHVHILTRTSVRRKLVRPGSCVRAKPRPPLDRSND